MIFAISAPFWWFFELLNESIDNWTYLTPWEFGWLGRGLIGSLSFSTVIPAVLTTAELIASFGRERWRPAAHVVPGTRGLLAIHLLGWLMLVGMIIWPQYLFPFCWISVFLILDPLARFAGATTVSSYAARGDWRPIFNLAIAGLICGWFWEMWNIMAMPKWIYSVPHVGFLKIWEMPALGYGGYIPFAFEIFAFYALVTAILPWFDPDNMRISRVPEIDPDADRYI